MINVENRNNSLVMRNSFEAQIQRDSMGNNYPLKSRNNAKAHSKSLSSLSEQINSIVTTSERKGTMSNETFVTYSSKK